MFEKLAQGLGLKKNKFTNQQVFYLIFILILLWPVMNSLISARQVTLAYSSFRSQIDAGLIQSVVIDAQRIRGILRDGSRFTTVRVEDPGLFDALSESRVEVSGKVSSSILGMILPAIILMAFWLFMMRRMAARSGGIGGGVFSFSKSKARVTQGQQSGVTFKDIGGAAEAITDLKEVTEFLKNPAHFQRLGGQMPKGVLLVGQPGTGKTLLARATAGEAGVPFFSLSGAEFIEMFVGVGASRVRDLFAQAKISAPAIIFIDEIDAIGGRRGSVAGFSSNDEREQTLNQLLAEMDGFLPTTGLILIGATNRPEILDPALLRPGRFDRRVVVGLPDLSGRREILDIHLKSIVLGPEVDHESLARITPGFSGADLANVINEAALLASRDEKEAVTNVDFDEAIERVIAGSERRTHAMNEHEKRVVSAHEAGHALVAALLPNVDPVHKVSVIPRGNALGYTWQRPIEDRYLMGQEELLNRIMVLLGGRAAEILVFSEAFTGAADDIERATDLSRRMVTEYGMSALLGPVRFAPEAQAQYLGGGALVDPGLSPRTAQRIDDETTRLVRMALDQAKVLLEEHRTALDSLSLQLRENETVSGSQISAIIEESRKGVLHDKT
jgi:cell division protease FtsH